ncbi:MAG: M48 family metallopeptidase [Bacteroidetes bacterium]|nr:M48 family metallopeptidase [Bacteroidota bacterium]MCL2301632.1 M48 family metallopeptidase [Lentimicrobiaceae bacterium]
MKYLGIQTQQRRNNFKSMLLLLMFPALLIGLVYLFFVIIHWQDPQNQISAGQATLEALPFVIIATTIWFIIAYFINTAMIRNATHAVPLERRDNKRVYNLVENLCMANGMDMPKVNVIEDNSLNAFASGISKNTYTVTLTRGIINKLDDQELEGVIAHELMHIKNRDVRLLVVSIIFVGIFTMIAQMATRMAFFGSMGRSNNNKNGAGALIMLLIVAVLGVLGYTFSLLIRLAISRKREYMADAGAAQMTKNPLALASALRKISRNSVIEGIQREDIAQLYIEHKAQGPFSGLFATHPPIEKRIAVLEQF